MATEHRANAANETELTRQLAWVKHLAVALVRNRDAADDLTQEAAAAWMTCRPHWATGGIGLRAWLARAVRSLAVDRGRAERARRRREGEVGAELAARSAEGTYEVVARLERQQRISAIVQALPEPYRASILYRFLDELPTAAVAARMGVSEATVRKRIERGLELLRERLASEFGSRSQAWCLGLLEPVLRRQVEATLVGGGVAIVVQGVGIMSSKWLAGIAAALVISSLAWYLVGSNDARVDAEVGGRGVVVSASVAAAREVAAATAAATAAREGDAVRTAASPEPVAARRVYGFLFVDGEHRAPADLAIAVGRNERAVVLDVAAATWEYAPGDGEPATLWITSSSTVPAQVPVPSELLASGGVFDLHLSSGRSLALLFVDEATRAPLTGLEFEVTKVIELERRNWRVFSRGSESRHRTDESGCAVVTGIPELGWVYVHVDLARRDRDVLFADGKTIRARNAASPIWACELGPDQPRRIEATIVTNPLLGEGSARGQIPSWALVQGKGFTSVRAVVRQQGKVGTDYRGLGDPFVLPQDEMGNVTLLATVPSQHRVWLERLDRTPLSAEVVVTFERTGAQAPIVFTPLVQATLRLRCTNVPVSGVLEVSVAGSTGAPRSERHDCAGEPFGLELAVVAGDQVQVRLRAAADGLRKSGWARQLQVGADAQEIALDLAGSWREIEIAADGVDRTGIAVISLLPCRDGQVVIDERVTVSCSDGRGQVAVHVPPGRWLYLGAASTPLSGPVVWGVVDVLTAATETLALRPRQYQVPAAELQPAIRFDELEGISLRALPESLRVLRVPDDGGSVSLPLDLVYVRLPK